MENIWVKTSKTYLLLGLCLFGITMGNVFIRKEEGISVIKINSVAQLENMDLIGERPNV